MHPSFRSCSLAAILAVLSLAATAPSRAQTAPAAPAASATAAATAFKINLSPPFKIGQKYSLINSTTSDMDMTITVSAPGLPTPQVQHIKQNSVIHLEADCEVLAVTAEGQPKKIIVTVKALKATQDGKDVPGLPVAGDKITAESTGKNDKIFTVGGKSLTPQITSLLKTFIPVGRDGTNDQIMFGPKDPVAVGGTWRPGPALLADMQESMPTATGVQGQLKLESVQGSGDTLVAKVSGSLSILGATAPLPPPMNAIPAQSTIQLSGTFPATAKGTFDESLKMNVKIVGETDANGAHLKVDALATQSGTQTITVP